MANNLDPFSHLPKHYPTWLEIESFCESLCREITAAHYQPDILVTIQRGGLIPATILSHRLGCRQLVVLDIRHTATDGSYAEWASLTMKPSIGLHAVKHQNVLVIDDILASGQTLARTLRVVGEYQPRAIKTAILFKNEERYKRSELYSKLPVDFLAQTLSGQDAGWVIFPWETRLEYTKEHSTYVSQVSPASVHTRGI